MKGFLQCIMVLLIFVLAFCAEGLADSVQWEGHIGLGEIQQWISIKGEDKDNPILLFFHGGPGFPETPAINKYNAELQEAFLVVNWDQRGAGKSYCPDIPAETFTLEQFIDDAHELVLYLQERFDREKIYIMGHSWGTIIGTHLAHRYPHLFYAYIGVGQAVHFVEAELISYQFTVQQAETLQHEKALEELRELGPPPYPQREDISIQRKWLFTFGGEVYGESSNFRYLLGILWDFIRDPSYSLGDILNTYRGNNRSGELLWDDLMAVNFFEQVPSLDIPVYFLTGRYDYVTVFEMVEKYYEVLEAPYKEIIWFQQSGHSPMYEEPQAFNRVLMEEILISTYNE